MRSSLLFLFVFLVGCSNHSNDPKSCRERVTKSIVTIYPDPVNLGKALDIVCGLQETTP